MPLVIEPLSKQHDRSKFSSGSPELDNWFRQRASQDEKRNVARVFVACEDNRVVGFYSVSTFTLALDNLPSDLSRKLPNYEAIPTALIGRLARDLEVRGKGIGELLLTDAIRRIVSAGQSVAVYAIVVDAKDQQAADFYRDYGFVPLPSRPLRLFLLVSSAIAALQKASS